jgi:hypothetical protein
LLDFSRSPEIFNESGTKISDSAGRPLGALSPQVASTSTVILSNQSVAQQFINIRPESELLAPTSSVQFKSQQIISFSSTQGETIFVLSCLIYARKDHLNLLKWSFAKTLVGTFCILTAS